MFDADNTLFDFDKAEYHAFGKALRVNGFELDYEYAYKLYHGINKSLWEEFEKGEVTKAVLTIRRFEKTFEKLGIKCEPESFNQLYMKLLGDGNFLYAGAEDICRKLCARCRLFIITNGVGTTQRRRFDASPIKPYFEDIFISEEIGFQKPDKRYFDSVFKKIPEINPSSALVVGDSLTSDIKGANNAGLDSCWYNPKKLPAYTDMSYTYMITDLKELEAIV